MKYLTYVVVLLAGIALIPASGAVYGMLTAKNGEGGEMSVQNVSNAVTTGVTSVLKPVVIIPVAIASGVLLLIRNTLLKKQKFQL